jgi:hypothetical protein
LGIDSECDRLQSRDHREDCQAPQTGGVRRAPPMPPAYIGEDFVMVRGAHARNLILQRIFLLCLLALLMPRDAQAGDKEPTAIVELGGAGEWDSPASSSFGPTAAVEFTPIKEWLEIEAGVAPMFNHGRAEWNTDLRFKKPFTLSDKVEFMIGVGPQWMRREGQKLPASSRSTLCSGLHPTENSAGF